MNEEERIATAGGSAGLAMTERTPEMIGAEIRMYYEAGRRVTMLCGIEIGRRLVEAKEMLKHGEWLPWLEHETAFSERHAQNYMRVFREYGAAQLGLFGPESNAKYIADLPISKALALLYLPENERDSFAEDIDAESISVRELERLVKERTAEIEAEKEKLEKAHAVQLHDAETAMEESEAAREKAEQARADAENQLRRIKQELEEIEKRPQAVAYERDEEAIAQAVQAERARMEAERATAISKAANDAADAERARYAEAEKQAKEKIAALEGQIKLAAATRETIEKELKEAQAKAEAAEKAGADSEALKSQVENLQKQLALAAPEVAEFKAAFDRAQKEMTRALEALAAVQDELVRGKLRKAWAAVLSAFAERGAE